eukprot:scaffold170192_cov42-Prasinocladus_malaysianus.AAC.1
MPRRGGRGLWDCKNGKDGARHCANPASGRRGRRLWPGGGTTSAAGGTHPASPHARLYGVMKHAIYSGVCPL